MNRPTVSLTTRDVVATALRTAAAEIARTATGALVDEPDGVHQHRVRVRRLRSVLAGFRRSLDTRTADALRVRYAFLILFNSSARLSSSVTM